MFKFNEEKLKKYMDSLGDKYIPGRDVKVCQNHKEIFRYGSGYSDFDKKKPVSENDVYLLYSSSKLITCTGALRLIEAGKLELSDPVFKFIPSFKNITVKENGNIRPAKTVMTIRDLFTMCGGLSYDKTNNPYLKKISENDEASEAEVVSQFAKMPLDFDPGASFQYSFCHDVLGAVIEVISGKSLNDYLTDEIFKPLEMSNTGFHLSEKMSENRVAYYSFDNENKTLSKGSDGSYFKLNKKYESGGAGIYTTVDDYSKFADALACKGTGFNGYRLLRPQTVEAFGTNQLNANQLKAFEEKTGHLGHGYGLGVSVLMDKKPRHFNCPVGTFGWGGAAGTRVFIVPEYNLSVFYAQEVEGPACSPVYEEHQHNVIINIIFEG